MIGQWAGCVANQYKQYSGAPMRQTGDVGNCALLVLLLPLKQVTESQSMVFSLTSLTFSSVSHKAHASDRFFFLCTQANCLKSLSLSFQKSIATPTTHNCTCPLDLVTSQMRQPLFKQWSPASWTYRDGCGLTN